MHTTFARFSSALRHADVRVSPAETIDALEVAERVGFQDRALLKDALALTLAKSIDEKARFDETFERFFSLAFQEPVKSSFVRPVDTESLLKSLDAQLSGQLKAHLETAIAQDHSALSLAVAQAGEGAGVHRMASLREKPLVVGEIERALKVDELDFFLREGEGAAIEGQRGALLRYLRKYFRDQIRDYVDEQYRLNVDATGKKALLDAALRSNLDQLPKAYHDDVRAVVLKLADKLAREHRRRKKRAQRGQLDVRKTLRRNVAYDGNLFDLRWRMQKRERSTVYVLNLDHRSTLIILGDGRNNFYDPRISLFKELTNRCKQVFWLNPESREQWREGDSEMRRYAPYCTRVALCTKLKDIERFADDLLNATL